MSYTRMGIPIRSIPTGDEAMGTTASEMHYIVRYRSRGRFACRASAG